MSRLMRIWPGHGLEESHAAEGLVCGADEAGRGPWAGPLFAAAVILPQEPARRPKGLRDSKLLSPKRREALAAEIRASAIACEVAEASVEEVDQINPLQASLLAMRRALLKLRVNRPIKRALIDGPYAPADLPFKADPVVHGDALEDVIAAASIIAKTARDHHMRELASAHPEYGWDHNMGYGTAEHRAALMRHGPVKGVHRMSYRPMKNMSPS